MNKGRGLEGFEASVLINVGSLLKAGIWRPEGHLLHVLRYMIV